MGTFSYADWVESHLDKAAPSAGGEWTANCPACGKFGGFYVNCDPDHEHAGRWVCFKCDAKGKNFAALIALAMGIEYADARKLMLRDEVEFRRRETVDTLKERIKAIRRQGALDWEEAWGEQTRVDGGLPEDFRPVWNLKTKTWDVPDYLTDRGFYRETLRDWGVGYCKLGRYGGRAIIPFECPNGRSFTGRDMTGEQEPKYLNPGGIDHGRLLYGWDKVPMNSDFALVEGPLDSMKFNQHGIPALGCGGKVLRLDQLLMLFQRPEHVRVVVMFDPEERMAPFGAAEQLIARFRNLYIGRLPMGFDPGDAPRKVARRSYLKAVHYDGNRAARVSFAMDSLRERLSKRFR